MYQVSVKARNKVKKHLERKVFCCSARGEFRREISKFVYNLMFFETLQGKLTTKLTHLVASKELRWIFKCSGLLMFSTVGPCPFRVNSHFLPRPHGKDDHGRSFSAESSQSGLRGFNICNFSCVFDKIIQTDRSPFWRIRVKPCF